MPSPYVPVGDLSLLKLVFVDSIGIALISYVISLSLARIMASKHRYQVGARNLDAGAPESDRTA